MENENQTVSPTVVPTAEETHKTEIIHIDDTETGLRHADVLYSYVPNEIINAYQEADGTLVYSCQNGIALKVQVVTQQILRFRYALEGHFQTDFSYALSNNWCDPHPRFTTGSTDETYFVDTGILHLQISKKDLKATITEVQTQQILSQDAHPFFASSTILRGVDQIKISKKAPGGEAYFGLGDKTCNQNLRGQQQENWNTDSFGFTKETDPLYRSIPFYYGLNQGVAYGIFLHNTWRTAFDFDSRETGELSFSANGGEMDYFFMYGPKLVDVATQYLNLTGRPELPPLWALGFHQCRWSYYPERRVRDIAAEFRKREIPCDAIYLDIDYMNGYRCFTWNKSHFPNPSKMISDLKEEGFHTVVMIDPGIREDPRYHVYQEGLKKDLFCRRSSGELMKGPVWPPVCVFPDFTNPEAREWWQGLYHDLYVEDGVSGFWNDMNEPAIFKIHHMTFPDNILHDFDGLRGDHRKAHNIYGQQMSRSTYEGLKALQPEKRPFVLTRATFSGGQRFASVWTGDNAASWEHLRLANIQCQRLSISGFSFVGSDIGGFIDVPSGELFVRWLQLAAFHPLYRVHSMGNNTDGAAEADADEIKVAEANNRLDQEPWSFGEPYTQLAKEAIAFRYQIMPYLYTAFQQHVKHGIPILKSLAFADQCDPEACQREDEFIVGEDILVAPVLAADMEDLQVYLPQGEWLDYYTGKTFQGRQFITVQTTEDRLPLFVRAGAIIPNYPVMQYTGEKVVEYPTLRVYSGSKANSLFYHDSGDGYGYQNGNYLLYKFSTEETEAELSIELEIEGLYEATFKGFEFVVFGLEEEPTKISVDGVIKAHQFKDNQLSFQVDNLFKKVQISL